MKIAAIILVIACVSPWAASADIPELDLSTAVLPPGAAGAHLFTRLDGGGHAFTSARLANGATVDATITLTLVNVYGHPIRNYPAEDIWLESHDDGLVYTTPTSPDAATDDLGRAFWIEPLAASGCSVGETVTVMVAGSPLNQAGLDLAFVSADLNSDLLVNLSDLSRFSAGYAGHYDACADLLFDGAVNISDLALFSGAYGQ